MCEKWRLEHETEHCHCYGPSNVRRLCCPRELNKKELGTCPTTIPLALSKATAFRSWGFPASCQTCIISPVLGFHIPLKIWWPWITLSWRKIESSDTGVLVVSVLVICSMFTITCFLMLGVATIMRACVCVRVCGRVHVYVCACVCTACASVCVWACMRMCVYMCKQEQGIP